MVIQYCKRVLRWCWLASLWSVFVFCLLTLLLAFLLLPYLPAYRDSIAGWASDYFNHPVVIGNIQTQWQWGKPLLRLQQVQLLEQDNRQPLLTIGSMEASVDVLHSLSTGTLITDRVALYAEQVRVIRQRDGTLHVQGLPREVDSHAPPPPKLTTTESETDDDLIAWVLRQPSITISVQHLYWQSTPDAASQIVRNAQLTVQQQDGIHRINGLVDLPAFAPLPAGRVSVNAISRWQQNQLDKLSMTLAFAPQQAEPIQVDMWLSKTAPKQWNGRVEQLQVGEQMLTAAPLNIEVGNEADGSVQVHGELAWLDLKIVTPLLASLQPRTLKLWQPLQVRGLVQDLAFNIDKGFQVEAKVAGLYTQAHEWLPQLEQFNLALWATEAGATVTLQGKQLALDNPKAYSQPLVFSDLRTELEIAPQPKAIALRIKQLQAQRDTATLVAQGEVVLLDDGEPVADLDIELSNVTATQVHRFFPDKELAKTSGWLKKSLRGGTIKHARARINGELREQALLKKGLQVEADIHDVLLQYQAGWPAIHNLNAQLSITNDKLHLTSQHGHLYNSHIKQATVEIAPLSGKDPPISIRGSVASFARDGLQFLREAPIAEGFDLEKEGFQFEGRATVELDLLIPLSPEPDVIKGAVRFHDAQLRNPDLGVDVQQVNGWLDFTNDWLTSRDLHGQLYAQPIQTSLRAGLSGQGEATQIQVQGQGDAALLQRYITHFAPTLDILQFDRHLNGSTDWQLDISLPSNKQMHNGAPLDIHFNSNMVGLDVSLPMPATKSATAKLPLHLHTRLEPQRDTVKLHYGDRWNLALQFDAQGFTHGTVQLNDVAAVLSDSAALQIHGSVVEVPLFEWLAILLADDTSDVSDQEDITLPPIEARDLTVGTLWLGTQRLDQVKLNLSQEHNLWHSRIDSQQAQGEIRVSPSFIEADLNRWHLSFLPTADDASESSVQEGDNVPDPRQLPSVEMRCADLQVDTFDFGTVQVRGHPLPEGMQFTFNAQHTGMALTAKAQWTLDKQGKHHSQVEAKIDSDNVAALLNHFDHDPAPLNAPHGEVALDVYWPSSLVDFNLANIVGTLSLLVTQGQMLDLEPGNMGRLLGLFDMFALPQRLQMDFRDVFVKGFNFQVLAGDFALKDGSAFTDNLTFQAPAARVHIDGRTGLVARDYDQTATIYPQVSNPLPLVGVLAGGLTVGAAALVIQKILQPQIEQTLNYQYRISGSWDAPQIEPVKPVVENKVSEEEIEEETEH